MSREIRRVPPDWEHPKFEEQGEYPWMKAGVYKPTFDQDFETAAKEFIEEFIKHEGKYPGDDEYFYWEYDNPPNRDRYRSRKWTPEEATHYQMYETVSEGTPVSPIFATLQELEDWLVNANGYSRSAAQAFCESGSSIGSFVIQNGVACDGIAAFDLA